MFKPKDPIKVEQARRERIPMPEKKGPRDCTDAEILSLYHGSLEPNAARGLKDYYQRNEIAARAAASVKKESSLPDQAAQLLQFSESRRPQTDKELDYVTDTHTGTTAAVVRNGDNFLIARIQNEERNSASYDAKVDKVSAFSAIPAKSEQKEGGDSSVRINTSENDFQGVHIFLQDRNKKLPAIAVQIGPEHFQTRPSGTVGQQQVLEALIKQGHTRVGYEDAARYVSNMHLIYSYEKGPGGEEILKLENIGKNTDVPVHARVDFAKNNEEAATAS